MEAISPSLCLLSTVHISTALSSVNFVTGELEFEPEITNASR